MRHWILALMIALLPLRGWVGDAMAFSMLAQQHGSASVASMPCHDMAPMADSTPLDSKAHAPAAPQAHTVCDVCNGPALHAPAPVAAVMPPVLSVQAETSERFLSAWPERGAKPPIA